MKVAASPQIYMGDARRFAMAGFPRIAKPLPFGKGPPAGWGIGRKVCRQPVRRYRTNYGRGRAESVIRQM